MIADEQLRTLFKTESSERLQHLDDGLLRLENKQSDPALLEELFREAHSLKGAARIVGLTEIQDLAHQLEDNLGLVKAAGAAPPPETLASLNQTLEAIRRLVQTAIGKTNSKDDDIHKATSPPPIPPTPEQAPDLAPPAAPKPEAFRIETMRVDPKNLDTLLTQAGELTVTKIRIAHRLTDIDKLLDYCEEWTKVVHSAQAPFISNRQISPRLESLQEMLSQLRTSAYEDSARLDFVTDKLESGIRTLRLLPMSTLFMLFPRLVHDLARDQHKEVELLIEGEEAVADKRVLEEMKDPLMHILRNAIDHGIETPELREQMGKARTATIRIKASQTPNAIILEVNDDGRGLDIGEIRHTALTLGMHSEQELAGMSEAQIQALILTPGFSTSSFITEISGRGVGLDVVRNKVEQLKGTLQLESSPGKEMTLRLHLPISLATVRVLIVATQGSHYALPVETVQFSRKVALNETYLIEGRQTVSIDAQPTSVSRLDELLELPVPRVRNSQSTVTCVFLTVGDERFGLIVDEVIDELEVVMKPQSKLLKRVRNLSGATILDTGEVCMVLNPQDLLKTLCKRSVASAPAAATKPESTKKVLLLAEDSITTRVQEKRILEGAGYEVVTAVDGADAFNKLSTRSFDAVVSDVMMPNMTGLALAQKIRTDSKHAELPIILVTSMASEEDQRLGLEAGANAYIAKPAFDQQVLLECLARLI